MKLLTTLEKNKQFWFLVFVSFFFFLLRFPSLFEPYWYGDEGIYQVLGKGILSGKLLYEEIWDNKPPLLYVLYAFFSGDQFALKSLSLLFGIFAINTFFLLAKKLYTTNTKTPRSTYLATLLFALFFGLPYLEGNIANAENFMLFPLLLAGFLIYSITSTTQFSRQRTIFLAGFLLGITFLIKIVAIFDTAAFFIFFVLMSYLHEPHLFRSVKQTMPLIVGFILPILLTTLFFASQDAFASFYKATFLQNIGYVNYGNELFFPHGFLFVKLSLLFIVTAWIIWKKNTLSSATIFVLLWFFYSIFNAFFSQRPYTHYLLVTLPSICLFICLLLEEKKYKKFYLVIFSISILLLYNNFYVYKKIIPYYQNFLSFVSGGKSVAAYQSFFDNNTPKDYEVVGFINNYTKPEDHIFLWSNSAQMYALTNKLPPGRYTVAYHITASEETRKETEEALYKVNPKYIIINSKQGEFPFSLVGYKAKIMLNNHTIYERIN